MGLFKVLIAKVPRHKISRDRNVIINVVRKTINFISLLGSKLVTHSVDPSSSVTADTDNLFKALSLEQQPPLPSLRGKGNIGIFLRTFEFHFDEILFRSKLYSCHPQKILNLQLDSISNSPYETLDIWFIRFEQQECHIVKSGRSCYSTAVTREPVNPSVGRYFFPPFENDPINRDEYYSTFQRDLLFFFLLVPSNMKCGPRIERGEWEVHWAGQGPLLADRARQWNTEDNDNTAHSQHTRLTFPRQTKQKHKLEAKLAPEICWDILNILDCVPQLSRELKTLSWYFSKLTGLHCEHFVNIRVKHNSYDTETRDKTQSNDQPNVKFDLWCKSPICCHSASSACQQRILQICSR